MHLTAAGQLAVEPLSDIDATTERPGLPGGMVAMTNNSGIRGITHTIHGRVIYPLVCQLLGEGSLGRRLEELGALQWRTTDWLLSRQQHDLLRLLRHAQSTTAFYRARIPEAALAAPEAALAHLHGIPLLDKDQLQRDTEALISSAAVGRKALKTTGGSTGQAVTVMKDRRATAMERAGMWLGYSWRGIQIGDRAARFWGLPSRRGGRLRAWLADAAMHRIRFSAFAFADVDLQRYWDACIRFRPDYFHGYVSMLDAFARYLESQSIDGRVLGLRAVVATSEVLTQLQRQRLERVFGAPVLIEYGCGEVGPIAYDCDAGALHILSPNVLVELLDPDGREVTEGQTGEVIVTDLVNRAMPLIRYRVGDYAVKGQSCACGRGFPTLGSVVGRAYDFVEDLTGRRYHGEYFLYAFEDLRARGLNVGPFKVSQSGPQSLELEVVAETQVWPDIERRLKEWALRGLPHFELVLMRRDTIPRRPSGKAEVVVNRWRQQAQTR